MKSAQVTLSDRLVAASLSALFVGVTLMVFPFAILILMRGRGLELLQVFGHFHVWATAVLALAGLCGFIAGSEQSSELLAHFWGTSKPRRPGITLGMWAAVVVVALLTNVLLGPPTP